VSEISTVPISYLYGNYSPEKDETKVYKENSSPDAGSDKKCF
jgi:hypothetical protein